jgi:hypothetical protein
MRTDKMSRFSLLLAFLAVLTVGGIAIAVAVGVKSFAPLRLAFEYPWNVLAQEAETMNRCVECHEPAQFHACGSCHDDHGAVEMAGVPFDSLLLLTGDAPRPGYIPINEILPYRDRPGSHVSLLDFLAAQGVTDFESVTLASRDEGFITFERPHLTPEAWLAPHVDGVRFVAENLHVSTWLKGIWRIVVVGQETPLTIDGQATSIGRLLLGPTRSVTVDQTEVMLKSETDGQVRRGKTASRLEGAPIEEIVAHPAFGQLLVYDGSGQAHTLMAAEVRGAVLALVGERVTLVLPQRGRAQWIADVVEVISEE